MRSVCPSCVVGRAKAQKRAARLARKALERARRVERVDPISICERDHWHCYLCGVHTPRELRGTYDDRAPEVDHVVPLAAGGAHSVDNLRCACRKCNLIKSDKPAPGRSRKLGASIQLGLAL